MRYLMMLALAIYSYGGLFDFNYLDKAKDAYSRGDYSTASQNYAKVNSEEAKYDLANSLYRQKKYKEALGIYNSISKKSLEFNKLHNMGNTLAQLGRTDEAIKAYGDALKIRDDKDTKFNLELLKKKHQNKKQDKNKKKNKEDKSSQKQNKKQSKDKNEKQKSQKDKKNENSKSDKKSQKNSADKREKKQNEKNQQKDHKDAKKQKEQEVKKDEKQSSRQPQKLKNQPISNMEERKWQKMLNQKKINTLILPIRKGENKNEKTPW